MEKGTFMTSKNVAIYQDNLPRAGRLGFWVVSLSQSRNGEVPQAKQGRRRPPGAFRRSEGGDCPLFRRRNPRSAVWALPCRRNCQVPEEGDPEGLCEEDGEEVESEGFHQARQLQPPDAHSLHPGRGSQGRSHRRRTSEQGQEGDGGQGDQGQVRGAVQDWEEQVVLYQAQVLSHVS